MAAEHDDGHQVCPGYSWGPDIRTSEGRGIRRQTREEREGTRTYDS
jgi:hypothetical protein